MLQKMAVEIESSLFLDKFLASKGVEYKAFDPDRFRNIYAKIAHNFQKPLKTIQVIGTNGKGSTASFLSQMLLSAGKTVGVFSSPHLFRFNERITLNYNHISDEELQLEHTKLLSILGTDMSEAISFFEYSSLISYSFLSSRCDYLILEAGLGGEFDATTVFPKELLLVTQIDIDHADLLGDTLDKIAKTKLEAIGCDTIINKNTQVVTDIAIKLANDRQCKLLKADELLSEDERELCLFTCRQNGFASFLCINMQLAMSAFKYLGFKPCVKSMPNAKPRGRFEKIMPNVTIDVGHNPACARAIKDELNNKKVQLVFNSMYDKDYQSSLMILKDNIAEVEIIDIDNERIIDRNKLESFLNQNNFAFTTFTDIQPSKEYLVFGSFAVAQKFIGIAELQK